MGFNHNIRHLGWVFHVQTEDSGVAVGHVITHLFQRGVILATRKLLYPPDRPDDDVKTLMQAQHKGVLRELRDGTHDAVIRQFLGEPPTWGPEAVFPSPGSGSSQSGALATASSALDVLAASWPQSPSLVQAADWEWRKDLLQDPLGPGSSAPRAAPPSREHRATGKVVAPRPSAPPPRTVTCRFPRPEDLLRAYFPNGRLGGMVVAPSTPLAVGEEVALALSIDGATSVDLSLDGQVAWVTAGNGTAGVAFPSHEHAAVRRMVLTCRGARVGRRKPGAHPLTGAGHVLLALTGGRRHAVEAEATEHGLFLPEDLGLEPGSLVPAILRALPPGKDLQVETVVDHRGADGVGLRFAPVEPAAARGITPWLDTLLRV
jgi:Tfp pilus assembly protein PilZ